MIIANDDSSIIRIFASTAALLEHLDDSLFPKSKSITVIRKNSFSNELVIYTAIYRKLAKMWQIDYIDDMSIHKFNPRLADYELVIEPRRDYQGFYEHVLFLVKKK